MGTFLTIPTPIIGTFWDILPPLGVKKWRFSFKMTHFSPILHGVSANFSPMMGAFFAICHVGHSRRGSHIRSNFPSEYPSRQYLLKMHSSNQSWEMTISAKPGKRIRPYCKVQNPNKLVLKLLIYLICVIFHFSTSCYTFVHDIVYLYINKVKNGLKHVQYIPNFIKLQAFSIT